MQEQELEGRRPLKVRGSRAAQAVAQWLSQRAVTPNQISVASVFFAGGAAALLVQSASAAGFGYSWLQLGAAACIQLRLLCNLFDGMVAVEGGKRTRSGELYNDIPDRIADPLILVAAGYSLGGFFHGEALGWAAGLLAVMTAYVRTLGSSLGLPADFSGPMAKQHRMAVMTGACLLSAFGPLFGWHGEVIAIALVIIVAGSVWTVISRAWRAYSALESNDRFQP